MPEMINGYRVIDAHAHIMPMRMIKPAPLAERHKTTRTRLLFGNL
jgi:hypothetical protein